MAFITWYQAQLDCIRAEGGYKWQTVDEAKACLDDIRLKQQKVRVLKNDIRREKRYIREEYSRRRAEVRASDAAYRARIAIRSRTRQREELRVYEHIGLAGYDMVDRDADTLLHWFDGAKLEINRWLTAHKLSKHP